MNDELLKNLSISCNHSKGTTFNYELALRKYCIYFDMELKDFLEEAEEDEMKGVKWKHSKLKSKLIEYRHHLFQNYAPGTVRKEMNCIIFFFTSSMTLKYCHFLKSTTKAFKSLL